MRKYTYGLLAMGIVLVGCGGNSHTNGGKSVDIRSMSAKAISDNIKMANNVKNRIKRANEQEENYTLIRKSDNEIQLTVRLDNPKGESIDALEISCDDKNAKILVDGEYKSIDVSASGRVVNWAQEDPYEKTFYIQTESDETLNLITINDIKVNGSWQKSELSNNVLEVYKLGSEDLKHSLIANTESYYECSFNIGNSISNFKVDGATDEGNGFYKVSSDGTMMYSFNFTYGEKTISWTNYLDIVLLKIEYTLRADPNDIRDRLVETQGDQTIINALFSGTGVSVEISKDREKWFVVDTIYKKSMRISSSIVSFDYGEHAFIRIAGVIYRVSSDQILVAM